MQDFIQLAANQLGIGSDAAEKATSGILGILKGKDSGDDGDKLLAAVPGAEQFITKAGGGALGGLGGLGGAIGGVSSMLGGSAGSGLGALAGLQASGLDVAKIGPFLGMFVEYAKQKAGPELVADFLKSMPAIAGLLPK